MLGIENFALGKQRLKLSKVILFKGHKEQYMKAFLGKQKLKEKAIALSNSAKSLLKFLRVRKFRLHGHASQGLVEKVTSSIPLLAAAW